MIPCKNFLSFVRMFVQNICSFYNPIILPEQTFVNGFSSKNRTYFLNICLLFKICCVKMNSAIKRKTFLRRFSYGTGQDLSLIHIYMCIRDSLLASRKIPFWSNRILKKLILWKRRRSWKASIISIKDMLFLNRSRSCVKAMNIILSPQEVITDFPTMITSPWMEKM